MNLKYFSIKDYEKIGTFLQRVKFEISHLNDYIIQSISPVMGRGVQTLTLVSNTLGTTVKLEVPEDMMDELKSHFEIASFNEKAKPRTRRPDGLDDIGDLYK